MSLRAFTLPERIIALESKAEVCEKSRTDVELRLRAVEKAIYFATGALGLLQIALKYLH